MEKNSPQKKELKNPLISRKFVTKIKLKYNSPAIFNPSNRNFSRDIMINNTIIPFLSAELTHTSNI